MKHIYLQSLILGLLMQACNPVQTWKDQLGPVLDEFGHRNWIVVADYAYPCQSAPGIQTIFTGEDHLEVLDRVLEEIASAPHVKPVIMVDRELDFVSETDAPGIENYRSALKKRLGDAEVSSMLHEDIIREMAASSDLFRVLILKTDMTLPYSSVFIELDCGYWDAGREKRLREAMEADSIH
jgi:hypothetical protein